MWIFVHFGKEIFFLRGEVKLRKIWNVEDLLVLENWNLKWRISRWTPNSPLPTQGSLLRGQPSGSVSNPNNFLLMLLQISLQFMFAPALMSLLFPSLSSTISNSITQQKKKMHPEIGTHLYLLFCNCLSYVLAQLISNEITEVDSYHSLKSRFSAWPVCRKLWIWIDRSISIKKFR